MWGTIRYYMLNVAVAPREGRVSRNYANRVAICLVCSRAPRGACE